MYVMFRPLRLLNKRKRKKKAFDRSPSKLFSLKFPNKSMQAPSCERPKTTQQTLFLSFEINNCFQLCNSIVSDGDTIFTSPSLKQ
jgi:hypothetical protein